MMDPKIGWYQPEQEGPARDTWTRIWDSCQYQGRSYKPSPHPQDFKSPDIPAEGAKENRARTFGWGTSLSTRSTNKDGCPWLKSDKIYSRGTTGLHEEIEDFYNWMSPTVEEANLRFSVVLKIKAAVGTLWPEALVEVFGSFRTRLYLPTSDIDLVVHGDWEMISLRILLDTLVERGIADPNNSQIFDKATVPIVRLTEAASDLKVDISFNIKNGVNSAKLIKEYCIQYPALPKLVLVLKQFLLERDLNEVFNGGISSYSLILMTVSFLQLHRRKAAGDKEASLGVLLVEFLELFGRDFNYLRTGITVKDGGCYVPKEVMQARMVDGFRPSLLCIEDPLTEGNDIGRGSYGALTVRSAFAYAYIQLSQVLNQQGRMSDPNINSILGRIVRVTDRVVNYRNWIKEKFPLPHPTAPDEA